MWWADVYEPDDLEYSAPDLYEAFVHSADYDPDAHWVRRKEYGDGHGREPAGRRLAHEGRHRGDGAAQGHAEEPAGCRLRRSAGEAGERNIVFWEAEYGGG